MISTIDMMLTLYNTKSTYEVKWYFRVSLSYSFFNNKNNFEKVVDNIICQWYYIHIKLINNSFRKNNIINAWQIDRQVLKYKYSKY